MTRPTPPWIRAEHIDGVILGLSLAAMAIDHVYRHPSQSLPATATVFLAP